ncbi:hypothetical protein [Agrobacterium tumefaciens]|uniref:hypothetical protein n=1 Tax=Agrobacterium tumefaciens TaxID=358 RepID=UPI003AF9300E
MPGHDDDFDRRPAVSNSHRELLSVHAAWHIDVGKDDADMGASLQDSDRLSRVEDELLPLPLDFDHDLLRRALFRWPPVSLQMSGYDSTS